MKRNAFLAAGLGAVVALSLGSYGCSSSSNSGSGGSTGSAGHAGTTGTGGASSGTGGSQSGTGGNQAAGGASGGQGGAPGTDGGLMICTTPPADKSGCQGTEATCTKACGPNVVDLGMGRPQKACACTGAAVAGFPMSWDCTGAGLCTWAPALAAVACFHLPTPVPLCPADTADGGTGLIRPNASTCTLTTGTCGLTCGSPTVASYQDSSGAGKMGYCVCVARPAGGARWQCASTAEWAPQ